MMLLRAPSPYPCGGSTGSFTEKKNISSRPSQNWGRLTPETAPTMEHGVLPRPLAQRRVKPQRHPQADGHPHGHHGQLEGRPDARGEKPGHRFAPQERLAEIAHQQFAHVVQVADVQRFVQPPLLLHQLDVGGVDIGFLRPAGHEGGIARQNVQEQEQNQRDADDGRDELEQSAQGVSGHQELPERKAPAQRVCHKTLWAGLDPEVRRTSIAAISAWPAANCRRPTLRSYPGTSVRWPRASSP